MAVGGGGLIGIIVTLILVFTGGGGGLGSLAGLEGEVVGTPQAGGGEVETECQVSDTAEQRDDCRLLAVINSIQAYWTGAFQGSNPGYEAVDTVFFDGEVNTACGAATSAVGPFYCPGDRLVYIDLGFFDTLEEQFGAKGGPFAQAYVLGHEYGHHVQNLLGVLEQTGGDREGPESLAVRSELQADCYAGVWAANAVSEGSLIVELTQQDIAEGLDAAAAVGDDRIQQRAQGQVNPETWTHGSSEQRQRWFTRGFESGNPGVCDTFSGAI
jgi:predicted metalloprotease